MRAFVKALSILLVGQLVSALEDTGSFGYAFTKFEKERSLIPAGAERKDLNLEEFYSMSFDGPSRLYFSNPDKSSEWQLQVNIERPKLDEWGRKLCTVSIKDDEKATLYYKLRSYDNKMDLLSVFRSYSDQKLNQLDIYAIDMTDCKVQVSEGLRGYQYPAKPIYDIKRYWDSDRIEFFTFNDEKSSCSYMNKYVYFISNNSFVGPMKFTMLDDKRDSKIWDFGPVEDEESYIANILSGNSHQVLKLDASGAVIKAGESHKLTGKSSQKSYPTVAFNHGYFGRCWTLDSNKPKMTITCSQYDSKLNRKLFQTMEWDYQSAMYAVQNRPEGGLRIASVKCSKEDEYMCDQPEIRLYVIAGNEQSRQYYSYKEKCALSKRQRFGFIDSYSSNCLYYSCSYKTRETEDYGSSVISKCF